MLLLSKLISVFIMMLGVFILWKPGRMGAMLEYWAQGRRLYLAAVIRLIFALILLSAAPHCRAAGWVIFFGVLFLLGGIVIFVLGLERTKSILRWWKDKPESFVRILAGIALAFGLGLLASI